KATSRLRRSRSRIPQIRLKPDPTSAAKAGSHVGQAGPKGPALLRRIARERHCDVIATTSVEGGLNEALGQAWQIVVSFENASHRLVAHEPVEAIARDHEQTFLGELDVVHFGFEL